MKSLLTSLLLIALTTTAIPSVASAQIVTKTLNLEIKNIPAIPSVATIQNFNNNSSDQKTEKIKIDPITINAPILQDYLNSKGSPLAPYSEDILKHENWKLVLAISNGESTMCKRQLYNNCWGVGGAWNLRRYDSFSDGFDDVNRLITDKYVAQGGDTPEKIVRKYVGHASPNWVAAVNQTLTQLDQLPLVD
jgi:hypothetical protein